MTQNERQRLIDLSWRYAALIGITTLDDIVPKEILDADRRQWAHLIKNGPSGQPAFIDEEAIEFMQKLSGMSYEDSAEVLLEEWSLEKGQPMEEEPRSTNDGLDKGTCLTCGGEVDVVRPAGEGNCPRCGPVEFEIQIRNGEQVEGYSVEAWRQGEIYRSSGAKPEELDPDEDIPF